MPHTRGGRRVVLAEEIRCELQSVGATVIGPAGALDTAIQLIAAEPEIDGALLDVNLGGEPVFEAVDLLSLRGVPMIFTTGYDASSIPARYAHIDRCEKPLSIPKVADLLRRLIHA